MDHKRHTHESNGEKGYECKGQLSRTRAEKTKAHKEHAEANKITKQSIKGVKRKYNDELATQAEQAAKAVNMKDPYDITKKLAGKRAKQKTSLKDKKGQQLEREKRTKKEMERAF